jgi:hypothetical protein
LTPTFAHANLSLLKQISETSNKKPGYRAWLFACFGGGLSLYTFAKEVILMKIIKLLMGFLVVVSPLAFPMKSGSGYPRNIKHTFNITLACNAIKKQDIKVLEKSLKDVSLGVQDTKVLLECAYRAKEHNESTALLSSETKKSIFATSCAALVMTGGAFLQVPLFCIGMTTSFRGLLTDRHFLLHSLGAAISLSAAYLSGKECLNGYHTDKPNYIYTRLATLFHLKSVRKFKLLGSQKSQLSFEFSE